MNLLLLSSGLAWVAVALIHAIAGGREILGPALAAPLGATVRATLAAAWHLITAHLLTMGAFSILAAVQPSEGVAGFAAALSAATAAAYGVVFLVVAVRRMGHPWNLPQWSLFFPITALSLAAVDPSSQLFGASAAGAAAWAAALVMWAISALHVAWAAGSAFPAADRDRLRSVVIGAAPTKGMPGRLATMVVAALLAGAGVWVLAAAGVVSLGALDRWLSVGGLLLALVFLVRGVGGFFEALVRPSIRGTPYQRWSRLLYSPLALLLAALIAIVVVGRDVV